MRLLVVDLQVQSGAVAEAGESVEVTEDDDRLHEVRHLPPRRFVALYELLRRVERKKTRR